MTRREQAAKRQRYDKEAARKAERVDFRGYVKVNITAKEKMEYDLWKGSQNVLAMFAEAVCAGYRISTFENRAENCFQANMYDENPKSPWAGYILSLRAKDPEAALERLLWFHFVALQENWGDQPTGASDDVW